ncbi:conserved hypothetical protein [Planctopirus limnophila DSM 3776]|uniref:DNA alkylation repair protein n=1 Tax=Planctopirus limnophila (strain ATCC 43296 / DSM 3776 / IFAM 1008 / Mu 290) TaxID=521674 RepID=D5SUB7_PLAL2|nr:DNA alkylation repair protein [Planctopirus limnophila]ADG69170.1 conserved hypothetical protein [Planctopirus limnophila DSM 3776]
MPRKSKAQRSSLSVNPSLAASKPARRRSEVSPETLAALETGKLATRNLVEWLAMDQLRLFTHLLDDLKLETTPELEQELESLRSVGVMQKSWGLGSLLARFITRHPRHPVILEELTTHPSDAVRIWTMTAIQSPTKLTLSQRLTAIRPFAADEHFGVRECAWMVVRPALVNDLPKSIHRLLPWAKHQDANLRRFAIESIRPCGVWCAHAPVLKAEPELALPILEQLRSDEARYVQLSVANWLNDSSKSQPEFVTSLCHRWLKESPTKETQWITHHAQRTLRKQGVGS